MRTIQEKNSSYNMMLRIWCDLCTFKRVVCICISFESKLDTEYTLCSVCHMICPHFGHETKVVDREMEKNSSHVDVRLLCSPLAWVNPLQRWIISGMDSPLNPF